MTTIVLAGGSPLALESKGYTSAQLTPMVMSTAFPGWGSGWSASHYDNIYRTQPEVRIAVSFLARSVAQLPIKAFERVEADDREPLWGAPIGQFLAAPLAQGTRYTWVYSMIADLGIYDETFWIIGGQREEILLRRLAPQDIIQVHADAAGRITALDVATTKGLYGMVTIPGDRVFYIRGYNPSGEARGMSVLDSLWATLMEDLAASTSRKAFWENGAKVSGVIERPLDAPEWSDPARTRFKTDWKSRYSGPSSAGETPILEDGMVYKPASATAAESQYVESRKLTSEEVARAYHIPPPMVGLLDKATYSNIQTQHTMLYQDTLGPILEQVQEEVERQLLPWFYRDPRRVYVEFNLQGKLQGDFETQITAMSKAIGRPYMTVNEGRSLLNLPPDESPEADLLTIPLNVSFSGADTAPSLESGDEEDEPTPSQEEPGAPTTLAAATPAVKALPALSAEDRKRWAKIVTDTRTQVDKAYQRELTDYFAEQKALTSGSPSEVNTPEWNQALTGRLRRVHHLAAQMLGDLLAEQRGLSWSPDRMSRYLQVAAEGDARALNDTTKARMEAVLVGGSKDLFGNDDEEADAYDQATGYRVALLGAGFATAYGMFGQKEVAQQNAEVIKMKTWMVTTGVRSRHPEMDGEEIAAGETFSNGAAYPGDGRAGIDEAAGCQCILTWR